MSEEPILGASPTRRRFPWQRGYSHRLVITDTLVVFATIFLVQVTWLEARGAQLVLVPIETAYAVPYWLVSLILAVLWLGMLSLTESRHPRHIGSGSQEYLGVGKATLWFGIVVVVLSYLLRTEVARGYLLLVLPLGLALLILVRWLWRQWLVARRAEGKDQSRVIIVGSPDSAVQIVSELSNSVFGFNVVAVVNAHDPQQPDGASLDVDGNRVPLIADDRRIVEQLERYDADTVIIASSEIRHSQWVKDIAWNLDAERHELVVAPGLLDISDTRIKHRPIAGLPLLLIETPSISRAGTVTKRVVDILVSSLLLVLLAPAVAVLAVAIKAGDGGPVFFRQKRVGYEGRAFWMLKFRSMRVDAEEGLGVLRSKPLDAGNDVLFKMKRDPRVTGIGRFLRRYSVDELPQLFNVLQGSMSLVGPRPPLASEVEQYDDRFKRRFFVKPGMTGLWQVSGRSDLSWDESVRIDLYYVENWSLMLDLTIVLRTAKAVLGGAGAY